MDEDEKGKNGAIKELGKLKINNLKEFFMWIGLLMFMILTYPFLYAFNKVNRGGEK